MIEINLSPSQKNIDITKVGGIDLSLINIKYLIPFFLAVYLVEPAIDMVYEEEIVKAEAQIIVSRKKNNQLRTELRSYDEVKRQVKELNAKEIQLKEKISVVKSIVDKRQNPFLLLKNLAENTPEDIWLLELEIDDRSFRMVGYSKSWKSIGLFIENIKSLVYFGPNVNFSKPDGIPEEINNNRVEAFEITAQVEKFY